MNLGIKPVVLSNSIEVLFEHLKANLFSEEVDVFSKRILFVPSSGINQWIQIRLASSLGVAAGLSPVFLDYGIIKLRELVFQQDAHKPLPTYLELYLEVDARLSEVLKDSAAIWTPLVQYVQGKEHRKRALTLYLTQLFESYGTCAGRASEAWESKPSNWQEALWAKVFSSWDYPQRALHHLNVKKSQSFNVSVHLFAFSYLCPLYFHFFRLVACHIPVYLYHLSPCQEFWSDLSSDHSILSTMGKMGRSMAKMIEESSLQTIENYIIFGGETQLKRVQRDLLQMHITNEVSDDPSIQVHHLSTKREEVLSVYNYLLDLVHREGILPSDILVMAPDISLYASYIQAIFIKLDFQIADMASQKESPIIEGVFLILDLEKKRWSAPVVLELFQHDLFQKKANLTDEELALLKVWINQTGIRWGVDGGHRAHLLQVSDNNNLIDDTATWLEGLGYLMEELAIPHEPTRIEFSQAETLGKIIQLITSLYQMTRELEKKKRVEEWVDFFKNLAKSYFAASEESQPFFSILDEIVKINSRFSENFYDYITIRTLIQESLGKKNVTINRNQLQAVRFCSMLPMRAIPAKVICLLGMNHDAFPRKEPLQAVNLLGKHPLCGYCPSRIDFDRSLFLDILLSVREKLYISYLAQDPFDLSECPPSSVVDCLLPMISEKQIYKHPPYLFEHPKIVTTKIHINDRFSLPEGDFEITLSEWKRFSRSFLGHYMHGRGFRIEETEMIQEEETFLLTPLQRAILRQKALTRISHTFSGSSHTLTPDLDRQGSEVVFIQHCPHYPDGQSQASERRFAAKKCEKSGLKESVDSFYASLNREGNFPPGTFGKLAKLQLQEEIERLPKNPLTQMVLQPFEFSVTKSLSVTFMGSLEGVFDEGICVQGKCDLKSAFKAWPMFVLLNAYDYSKSKLLFAASNEVKNAFFDDPTPFLRQLVELYLYAKTNPLLLAIDWIEPILQKNPKKLAQAHNYDTVLQWYLRGKGSINAQKWIETYYPILKATYGPLTHAWF